MNNKCKDVTCPACGAGFPVCFIDRGEQLTYVAICPECDNHFPVEL
jgi:transcription elongation factor Elf1